LNEFVPIVGGLLLGVIVGRVSACVRLPLAITGVTVIGMVAAIASGEFRVSWVFLAIDVGGTAVAAICSYCLVRSHARAAGRREAGTVSGADLGH
jgi:hypothetical protein